jgi:hypothetical protein
MEWQPPIVVIPRHSHFSTIYKNALFVYGGISSTLDPASELLKVDLSDTKQLSYTLKGPDDDATPSTLGQHFPQLCGSRLVVLITRSLKYDSDPDMDDPPSDDADEDIQTGVWSLDLEALRWHRHDEGAYLGHGSWHYYGMARDTTRMVLLGVGYPSSLRRRHRLNGMDSTTPTTPAAVDESEVEGGLLVNNVGAGLQQGARNMYPALIGNAGGSELVLSTAHSDQYMGTVLLLNLDIHGIFYVPPPKLSSDFESLWRGINSSQDSDLFDTCDVEVYSNDPLSPAVSCHRLILVFITFFCLQKKRSLWN